jgi:hypothetical protein
LFAALSPWQQAELFGWHDKSVVGTALGGTYGSEKIRLPRWIVGGKPLGLLAARRTFQMVWYTYKKKQTRQHGLGAEKIRLPCWIYGGEIS